MLVSLLNVLTIGIIIYEIEIISIMKWEKSLCAVLILVGWPVGIYNAKTIRDYISRR